MTPAASTPTPVHARLRADSAALLPDLQRLRRELHADPEIGRHLPRTQAKILAALDGLDLEITTGTALSSITAILRGAAPGPCVLLRADMDALPVAEDNELSYRSINGAMHACGHDLHTAGLVGAVRLLAARRETIVGSVVFMFQPDEEGDGGGGAAPMIAEGLLDAVGTRPVAAYALHVGPGEPGVFSTRPGPMLAGANMFTVTVQGAGGHATKPWLALDPVPVAAEIILALQTYQTRHVDLFDPTVLTVTMLEAGRAENVIPPRARITGTFRNLSDVALERTRRDLPRLVAGIADAHGCTGTVDFVEQYPVTVNDPDRTNAAVDTLTELLGAGRVVLEPNPNMGSEDFSYVLREVPGTFLFVGATPAGAAHPFATNHSPLIEFDDTVLADQAAALAALAMSHVGNPHSR